MRSHADCLCLLHAQQHPLMSKPCNIRCPVCAAYQSRLDCGNATLRHCVYLLKRLQSVMNWTIRLVFFAARLDYVSPLVPHIPPAEGPAAAWVQFKLTVLREDFSSYVASLT